jgi:cell division protein FtsA
LAEEVFHMPVRLGSPQYVEGMMDVIRNPIHATGVGLLLYGYEAIARRELRTPSGGSGIGDSFARMKSWFQGQF